MSADDPSESDSSASIFPSVAGVILLLLLGLMTAGFVAYRMLSQSMPPPPPEVTSDPLLMHGRTIFLGRCATCHGNEGRGDGPIAANLIGPPVGNLTDSEWKHGDRPDQVLRVIDKGVPDTRMQGWSHVLDPPELRAVAAYVYYLARHPVPSELRTPEP